MSTNYYLRSRFLKDEIIKCLQEDRIDEAKAHMESLELHIAKRSCGWLPLFQAHHGKFSSVRELEKYYSTFNCEIINEYDEVLTWDEFCAEVLSWNGGKRGAIKTTPIKEPIDPLMTYTPMSHMEYMLKAYGEDRFAWECSIGTWYIDHEGYEWTSEEFC